MDVACSPAHGRASIAVDGAVEVFEPLVVRQIAWAGPVEHGERQTGCLPLTRLVAWMYSAVDLGWLAATITPSRDTSTPTAIMLVASSTSIGGPHRAPAAR